jgi:cobalt-zinc-cadmium resistance protein CzcA
MINVFCSFAAIVLTCSVFAQDLKFADLSDSLVKNNPQIKELQLESDLALIRKKSTSYLGATSSIAQYGQISTSMKDIYYEIDQEIRNPFNTAAVRKSAELESELIDVRIQLTTDLLLKELTDLHDQTNYYALVLSIYQKEKALFDEYLQHAEQKRMTDEISSSEYALVKIQVSELAMRLQNAERAFHETEEQVRALCGITNNSSIQYDQEFSQELEINEYKTKPLSHRFEREFEEISKCRDQQILSSKLAYLPDFTAGYFNQSIDHERGFQGLRVGVSFSLLDGNNKLLIKQAQLEKNLNSDLQENRLLVLQNRLQNTIHHLEMNLNLLEELNSNENQEELDLNNYAEKGLENGELDPLMYIQLRQKTLEIQLVKEELALNLSLLQNEFDYLTKE